MRSWETDGSIERDTRYPRWVRRYGHHFPNWLLNLIANARR
jgi:hypothetical protein